MYQWYFVLINSGNSVIHNAEVERVMMRVDRGKYALRNAYQDSPQGIGYGVTISAPHMVGFFSFDC